MPGSSTTTDTTRIPIRTLLSILIDATAHGCHTIRTIRGTRTTSTTNLQTTYKVEGDSRSALTVADIAAQKIIVASLYRTLGGGIRIVGEEDFVEGEYDAKDGVDLNGALDVTFEEDESDGLIPILDSEYSDVDRDSVVNMKDVIIYIDPVDGTREFVEGRLENVQCLVGAVYRNRPLCGVIGRPFPGGGTEESVQVHFGLSSGGMGRKCVQFDEYGCGAYSSVTDPQTTPTPEKGEKDCIIVATGDSQDGILQTALQSALVLLRDQHQKDTRHVITGACGNKMLKVSQSSFHLTLMHDKTCSWDTASPTSILLSKGGKVTDLFGVDLVYTPVEVRNALGVLASARGYAIFHDGIAEKMRGDATVLSLLDSWRGALEKEEEDDAEVPQAVDIARDLDGLPLDVGYIGHHILQTLNIDEGCYRLKAYRAPESQTVRGLMSNGCRLSLFWEPKQQPPTPTVTDPPSTAFYKRIQMSSLAHARAKLKTAPHKLARDVNSYTVESAFLGSRACRDLIQHGGVRIPRAYAVDRIPCAESPIQSKFAVLLEDFNVADGWRQSWLLDYNECKAALGALADMHAYFWEGAEFWGCPQREEARRELREVVWPSGGYVQPALQGYAQLDKVASQYRHFLSSKFGEEGLNREEGLKGVDVGRMGDRLQRVVDEVGAEAYPFAAVTNSMPEGLSKKFLKYRTFTHGDPKQANIFLRTTNANDESSSFPGLEVGLIDFQWSGFGLAATDVAHLISAAVRASSLQDNQEEDLLNHYYSRLSASLIKFKVASSHEKILTDIYPRSVFQKHYETAILDMCRIVFAYSWSRYREEEVEGADSLNRNSYNKSRENVVWLIRRCDGILTDRGAV